MGYINIYNKNGVVYKYLCCLYRGEFTNCDIWIDLDRNYIPVKKTYHNPCGPAIITINDFGNIDENEWWLNGFQYTKEVNEYLDKHGLKWKNMDQLDFDIMWTMIL